LSSLAPEVIVLRMANASTLIEWHRSNGASIIERDDWLLPASFGDASAEYCAVRESVGLIDLPHRGLLQFSGPDRLSFLQGMLSNDLRNLKTFDGAYAALLTQQGKIVADVRVLCAMNSFYMDFWVQLKAKILEHVNRYLIADEVEIADRSGEYSIISVQGPRAKDLLRQVMPKEVQLPSRPKQHCMVAIEGAAVCAVNDSHTGEIGFDLIIPLPAMPELGWKLTESGAAIGARWVGEEALNVLRVEAGIPRWSVDFSEENLLLEVGLEDAVSFTKGCYLGQEVVERIRSRGHVNKRLCGLLLDGNSAASAGDVIASASKQVGAVTSSVFSPKLKRAIALGYVNREFWEVGTPLSVRVGGASVRATVTGLPFLGHA
jgi:folate-binding protein YgfZ